MSEQKFSIFADYFQFYLQDDATEDVPDLDGYDAAQTTRVIVQENGFTVLTARNMDVPVTVVVADGAPDYDADTWDHIAEFSIASPAGKLAIAGCTDYLPDAARIAVPAGTLRVRTLFGDQTKLSEDGLDGEDHYRIEIWPDAPTPLSIIKQM